MGIYRWPEGSPSQRVSNAESVIYKYLLDFDDKAEWNRCFSFRNIGIERSLRILYNDFDSSIQDVIDKSIWEILFWRFSSRCINWMHYVPTLTKYHIIWVGTLIARFMGPTWGPSGADRTQVGPCWPHKLCYLGSQLGEERLTVYPPSLTSIPSSGFFILS